MNDKKYFITAALPYVNNIPHLGNIIGSVLSGDIISRYLKKIGSDVIYLCGTDEYGSATIVKAISENLTPHEICNKYHGEHKKIYDWFNIKFDAWGRTSTQVHAEITHEIFNGLNNEGHILEKNITQQFCTNCNLFLADRFIKGICYHDTCKNIKSNAKGDQCDVCHQLIDATLLINPICITCGNNPELRTTAHLFVKLDEIIPKLIKYNTNLISSDNGKSITNTWLNAGIDARCITRDITWGVNVPLNNYSSKVFYVWFDAPFGYYSILASNMENWREYLESPNLEWISTQAKDNIPFHTLFFPGSIIGSNTSYPLINTICDTHYLLYEGKKFSKSENYGIFGDDVINISNMLDINEDYWRFYLLKIRPENHDSSFSLKEFAESVNVDLVNNIGNFINRVRGLAIKFTNSECSIKTTSELDKYKITYHEYMSEYKLRHAIMLSLQVSSYGNSHIQNTKPWESIKTNFEDTYQNISIAAGICIELLHMLEPFIPGTCQKIFESITLEKNNIRFKSNFELPFYKLDHILLEKEYNKKNIIDFTLDKLELN